MRIYTTFSMLAGLLLASSAFASTELVMNGGFETGTLSGWTSSNLGSGSCPMHSNDFNVSKVSATGCSSVANPSGSTYAAYAMNDGKGPLNYVLSQTLSVATGTTGGMFSFDLSSINTSDKNRTLAVFLKDTTTLNSLSLYSASTYSSNSAWKTINVDISAFLIAAAGDNIILSIDNYIPKSWTGPAGLGIDNVSVLANVSVNAVPEPDTYAMLLAGLSLMGFMVRRRKTS